MKRFSNYHLSTQHWLIHERLIIRHRLNTHDYVPKIRLVDNNLLIIVEDDMDCNVDIVSHIQKVMS